MTGWPCGVDQAAWLSGILESPFNRSIDHRVRADHPIIEKTASG
jgi:hypothetical protein